VNRFLVTAAALATVCGCHGNSSDLPQFPPCSWPANLNPPDAASWDVGRSFLSCLEANNNILCLSHDGTTCATNPVPGQTQTDCSDLCAIQEYAVVTAGDPVTLPDGGQAIPGGPPLAASCAPVNSLPSGSVINCCSCP
jgi:hypothetical protein